jgi:hypothetical protein
LTNYRKNPTLLRKGQRNGITSMSRTPLLAFIDQQVPPAKRAMIPAVLRRAYATVDQLFVDEPIFHVETAKQAKGHVIALAVDKQVEELIKNGDWPYDYKWEAFNKPTGRYLKIFLPNATMTVSQVPDKRSVPRHAGFRHNHILNNQLLLDYPEFESERRVRGMPHMLSTWVSKSCVFACWNTSPQETILD